MCYIGVRGVGRRDGAGDVEDAFASGDGGRHAGVVHHVGLEQPQPLPGAVERRQMRVLGITCLCAHTSIVDITREGELFNLIWIRSARPYSGREQCHARRSRRWRGGAARATRRRSPRRPSRTPPSPSSSRRRPYAGL
jgi:hypothetical protein